MRVDDAVAYPEGELTLATATRLLDEGEAALAQGCTAFDFSGVGEVDSAALSLILSWRRKAQGMERDLTFQNIPDSLDSLAKLYGVGELLNK